MKILVNMTFITPKNLSRSIPIYVFRFVRSIKAEDRQNYILLFNSKYVTFLHEIFPDFEYRTLFMGQLPLIKGFYKRLLPYTYSMKVDSIGADIHLNTVDIDYISQRKHKNKKIVVVHDLKLLKDPNNNKLKKQFQFYKTNMENADVVIAISEFTKKDIIAFFPQIDANKIHVIHNYIELSNFAVRPDHFPKKMDYVLYVNTLLKYKNVMTLIKAFNLIKDKTACNLVIIGRETNYWSEEVEPYIIENHLEERVKRLQNLSNDELKYVYERARLYVTTSTREGFGYTPIEAAICKCPVISTTCEALPETTLNKVEYYMPPEDHVQLSEKMLELLQNTPSRDKLEQLSATFRSHYSKERFYGKFRELFNRLTK